MNYATATLSDALAQRLLADLCLARDGGAAPVQAETPRLAVYRRLVRSNLLGVTARMMPRTRARLNAVGGAFDASFDDFLAERAPRTHYLRDVPAEFLAWVGPRWAADEGVPSFAADLAAYELLHFQIAAAPALPSAEPPTDLALDRGVAFCAARRLVRYGYAVHRLPEDEDDRTSPTAGEVALFVYRDPENAVRVLELDRAAAVLADRLLAGESLGAAVSAATAAAGPDAASGVVASVARVLADWGERGLLLGAAGKLPADGA